MPEPTRSSAAASTGDDPARDSTASPAGPQAPVSSTALNQLLLRIMEQITHFLDAERATLFLYDEARNELWSAVLVGDDTREIRVPADEGIVGQVFQLGQTANVPDAYADPRFNPEVDRRTGFRTRNILCHPVENKDGKRVGAVQVLNKRGRAFDRHDEILLSAIAAQSLMTIENAELKSQLEAQHRRLQEAFHTIETSKQALEERLRAKRWVRRFAAAFVVVLGLAIGGYFAQRSGLGSLARFLPGHDAQAATLSTAAGASYDTITVSTQPVTKWLRLKGAVRPVKWVEVTSPLASVVKEIGFRYGAPVNKGQVLAKLDASSYELQLRNARGEYLQALDEVNRLNNWGHSPAVLRAQREVDRADEALRSSKLDLNGVIRLFNQGIVSKHELEQARQSIEDQKLALASARDTLQSTLAQGSKSRLRIARLKLENARQRLSEEKDAVASAVIRSPTDGVIFASAHVEKGQGASAQQTQVGTAVSAGSALFAIADMREVSIEAEVPETDVLELKLGQTARVTFEALPGVDLQGRISYISGRGEQAQEGGGAGATFKVSVTVPAIRTADRERLRIGMSGVARVAVYHDPKAIVIPFDAVVVRGADRFVRVVTAGATEMRAIVIRSTEINGVQVKKGLKAGERILVSTFNSASHG